MAGAFMYDSYAQMPGLEISLEAAVEESSTSSGNSARRQRPRSNSDSSHSMHLRQQPSSPSLIPPMPSRIAKPGVPFLHKKRPPPITTQAAEPPRRPPRNPMRTSTSPPPVPPKTRLNAAQKLDDTLREEITPWEFVPPPPDYINVPASPPAASRSFGEQLMRRRKSTSASTSRKPSIGSIATKTSSQNINTIGTSRPNKRHSNVHMYSGTVTAEPVARNSNARPYSPPTSRPSTATSLKTVPAGNESVVNFTPTSIPLATLISSTSTSSSVDPLPPISNTASKFSTADRTILEELRRTIIARESQFVFKPGRASTVAWTPAKRAPRDALIDQANANYANLAFAHGAGVRVVPEPGYARGRSGTNPSIINNSNIDHRHKRKDSLFLTDKSQKRHRIQTGTKHHPYPRNQVPYPKSYEREALDFDIWETVFTQQLCGSLTWHEFIKPPTRVLDIGCGSGTWVLDVAHTWRDCHVVGLDIVPLHPDLNQVGSSLLATRVTWVQANFLEPLPFPNEEFDYVHIKRIALGVPEDKWDGLFEEIARVMKPGAAFEMIEEELFFPGNQMDDSVSEDGHSPAASRPSSENHNTSPGPRPANNSAEPVEVKFEFEQRALVSPLSPLPSTRGRSNSHATATTTTTKFSSTSALSLNSKELPLTPDAQQLLQPRKLSMASSTNSISPVSPNFPVLPKPLPTAATRETTNDPYMVRTQPQPPTNPRDHSLLELIYNEMNASRFVNLSPLSLLSNSLGLYFQDVRTHPTLQFNFPPPQVKASDIPMTPLPDPPKIQGGDEFDTDEELANKTDPDDAENAIISRMPRATRSSMSMASPTTLMALQENQDRWLSRRHLVAGASPYVTLDSGGSQKFSAVKKTLPEEVPNELSITGGDKTPMPNTANKRFAGSRLPNTTLNMDLRTLNLHLALRTQEILACAESMWETVLEYCAKQNEQGSSSPTPISAHGLPLENAFDAHKSTIMELTRKEFDGLLSNFNLDMRANMDLDTALENRFMWNAIRTPPPAAKQDFKDACVKWDKWRQEQKPLRPKLTHRHTESAVNESEMTELMDQLGIVDESEPIPHRLSRALRVFVAWKA